MFSCKVRLVIFPSFQCFLKEAHLMGLPWAPWESCSSVMESIYCLISFIVTDSYLERGRSLYVLFYKWVSFS